MNELDAATWSDVVANAIVHRILIDNWGILVAIGFVQVVAGALLAAGASYFMKKGELEAIRQDFEKALTRVERTRQVEIGVEMKRDLLLKLQGGANEMLAVMLAYANPAEGLGVIDGRTSAIVAHLRNARIVASPATINASTELSEFFARRTGYLRELRLRLDNQNVPESKRIQLAEALTTSAEKTIELLDPLLLAFEYSIRCDLGIDLFGDVAARENFEAAARARTEKIKVFMAELRLRLNDAIHG